MASANESVTWPRFVCDAGEFEKEDDGRFVDLVQVGEVVYERRGRIGADKERVSRRVLASVESAQKSLVERVAALEKEGFAEDDPVVRALPTIVDKAAKEDARARGRLDFEERFPAFVAAYAARGFDPTKTFVDAAIGKSTHPDAVARACLDAAMEGFAFGFSRRTYSYDMEHGRGANVSERDLASFYRRPAHVAALARENLLGRNRNHDDLDAPGLEDELQLRIVAIVRGPR